MKKSIAAALVLFGLTGILSAQDFDYAWDDLDYDWDTEIEEPPDFVDPYAPATQVPTQAAPAPSPAPMQTAPAPAAAPPAPVAPSPPPRQAAPSPAAPAPIAAPTQAQDFDYAWDDSEYDWNMVIEEPPDFVDPYAPATPTPVAPATPAPAPTPQAPAQLAPAPVTPPATPPFDPAPAPRQASPTQSAPSPVFAEPADRPTPVPAYIPAEPDQPTLRGKFYTLVYDGDEKDAALLLDEFEQRFNIYTQLFHFDPAAITGPLLIRAIGDNAAYEDYVNTKLHMVPEGAVYIHYNQETKRELVINRAAFNGASDSGDTLQTFLAHQAFIQYLRAFIPRPPAWMREGFGIFFSTLKFDPATKLLKFDENLSWLDMVKSLGDQAPEPKTLLLADTGEYPPEITGPFQAASWALASFLVNNSDENYFRTLAEVFMVLSPTAGAGENAQAVEKRLTLWTGYDTFAADYRNYLASRKTLTELLVAGQKAYSSGDRKAAELNFTEARAIKEDQGVPCYYLGLLAYNDRDFAKAGELFNAALEYGVDPALVRYALGLNAISAGRNAEGIGWLEQAAEAAPDRYREKTGKLIGQLRP
ncbi:tetratricopeptide repeat domain protein [Treponema primitia ZAS-2]|uniref:Tetratricopeptide repeat domain protein n=1 Tax=Treponema primitia (strain ATCC BAA-887 / DSM 12427 / ZAS-2) TaxID=545694 RepID=F5YMT1_TREPZ|nr:tetratricopeptide repeat protein [Treponema primitia]AEF84501.1 tetratricopeptide repeat domain protein [Treponema primitia ZAS-2]